MGRLKERWDIEARKMCKGELGKKWIMIDQNGKELSAYTRVDNDIDQFMISKLNPIKKTWLIANLKKNGITIIINYNNPLNDSP